MDKQLPLVGILMGSESDSEAMSAARETLAQFGIGCEYKAASAHRCPEIVCEYAKTAKARGIKVIIAGAGGAAHLAGVLAAHTILPVIGVPMTSALNGLDSLLSTAQMPPGIPVATMSIGKGGAKNAALLAVSILALSDPELAAKLEQFRVKQTAAAYKEL